MRKVTYKYAETDRSTVSGSGVFLKWGFEGDQDLQSTMAIIERKDGSIVMLHPTSIKFVEPTNNNKPTEDN